MAIMDWTKENMRLLGNFAKEVRDRGVMDGKRLGVVLHLEKKTAFLIESLLDSGATVYCASCNPLTADPEIIDYLTGKGAKVFARAYSNDKEYSEFLLSIAEKELDAVIDDGADMIDLLLQKKKMVKGACEETTTGIIRVRQMERKGLLKFPVIAVNDAHSKRLFDNVFGTGESTLNGIMNATNMTFAGKTVAIVGYGHCGKGIAKRAKAMGARVIVVESDLTDRFGYSGHHKAMEAHFEGYEVMDTNSACKSADMFITVTGNIGVLDKRHFAAMKDGVILANSGHFNIEIDVKWLDQNCESKKEVTKSITEYRLNGKRIHVLSEGRLVNLAKPAGQGHAIDIMDLSFSLQLLCLEKVLGDDLAPGLHGVPSELDQSVAKSFLKLKGISVEKLTGEQKDYLL